MTFSTPTVRSRYVSGTTSIDLSPTRRQASIFTRGSDSESSQRRTFPTRTHSPERLAAALSRSPIEGAALPLADQYTISSPSRSSTTAPLDFVSSCARRVTTSTTSRGSSPAAAISPCVAMIADRWCASSGLTDSLAVSDRKTCARTSLGVAVIALVAWGWPSTPV